MKSNSFSSLLIIILASFFFNCTNAEKRCSVQEGKEELDKHLAEMNARMKWPEVKAKDNPIDSLDIRIEDLSIPELDRSFDILGDSVFILSEEEFNIARELVKKRFAGVETSIDKDESEKPFPYNYYFKQYIGYKDHKKKKKLVRVNMFTAWHTPNGWVKDLKNIWLRVYDGGKWFGSMIVDVETREVSSIMLSAEV